MAMNSQSVFFSTRSEKMPMIFVHIYSPRANSSGCQTGTSLALCPLQLFSGIATVPMISLFERKRCWGNEIADMPYLNYYTTVLGTGREKRKLESAGFKGTLDLFQDDSIKEIIFLVDEDIGDVSNDVYHQYYDKILTPLSRQIIAFSEADQNSIRLECRIALASLAYSLDLENERNLHRNLSKLFVNLFFGDGLSFRGIRSAHFPSLDALVSGWVTSFLRAEFGDDIADRDLRLAMGYEALLCTLFICSFDADNPDGTLERMLPSIEDGEPLKTLSRQLRNRLYGKKRKQTASVYPVGDYLSDITSFEMSITKRVWNNASSHPRTVMAVFSKIAHLNAVPVIGEYDEGELGHTDLCRKYIHLTEKLEKKIDGIRPFSPAWMELGFNETINSINDECSALKKEFPCITGVSKSPDLVNLEAKYSTWKRGGDGSTLGQERYKHWGVDYRDQFQTMVSVPEKLTDAWINVSSIFLAPLPKFQASSNRNGKKSALLGLIRYLTGIVPEASGKSCLPFLQWQLSLVPALRQVAESKDRRQ